MITQEQKQAYHNGCYFPISPSEADLIAKTGAILDHDSGELAEYLRVIDTINEQLVELQAAHRGAVALVELRHVPADFVEKILDQYRELGWDCKHINSASHGNPDCGISTIQIVERRNTKAVAKTELKGSLDPGSTLYGVIMPDCYEGRNQPQCK